MKINNWASRTCKYKKKKKKKNIEKTPVDIDRLKIITIVTDILVAVFLTTSYESL